jgi:MOSC domain-containing protein YiiM
MNTESIALPKSFLRSHRRSVHAPQATTTPRLAAVCISPGGIPKRSVDVATVSELGIEGDGHAHAKHCRPDRAISLFDLEILLQLVDEGFPLAPGIAGENLTVEGLGVQKLLPGTRLSIGAVILRLEQPRKPCYVLDAIDPMLKDAIVGRCGYMASVLRGGVVYPGMAIKVLRSRAIIPPAAVRNGP